MSGRPKKLPVDFEPLPWFDDTESDNWEDCNDALPSPPGYPCPSRSGTTVTAGHLSYAASNSENESDITIPPVPTLPGSPNIPAIPIDIPQDNITSSDSEPESLHFTDNSYKVFLNKLAKKWISVELYKIRVVCLITTDYIS